MICSVSVAVPLFNEEESVPELLQRVNEALDLIPAGDHEILCIDDGSADRTLERLLAAKETYPRLRIISLSRNFGHQAALSAALDSAEGDAVLIIDGDLQDDPGVLPTFLNELHLGADVVYARRQNRPEGLVRRIGYWFHYRLLSLISDSPVQIDSGDFALLSRRAVDTLNRLPERQRYLRGLRAWIGLEQIAVDVDRNERVAGSSKYSLSDMMSLAFDGLFAFSRVPLRLATLLGLLTVLAGFGYGGYVLVARLSGNPPQGFATLALLQIGFSGMLLLVLGVVGEYIGRIYEEVKRRPIYVINREWKKGHNGG